MHARDKLVRQLVIPPAAPRLHLAATRHMPRQLEQVFFLPAEHRHVDEIGGPRRHHTSEGVESPLDPRPLTLVVEALAAGVARRLRCSIQARGVVCQRRTVPEQIVRDVRARARVRKPVHAVRMQHQLQPVGMAVTAALRTALETHVAAAPPEHRQALALEQDTLRLPRCLARGKVRQHLQQRPPGQRNASAVRRALCARVVQIGFLWLRGWRRHLIQRREPGPEINSAYGVRCTAHESGESDFPQLQISRLRQRDPEA